MTTIAVYPGTFDPITKGHIDIIKRAMGLVDVLLVAVAKDTGKTNLLSQDERTELVKFETKDFEKVKVIKFSGLLAKFFEEQKATFVIRGLRTMSDFENEFSMAVTNRKLYNGLETLFLPATESIQFTSSSFVRQITTLGGDISSFVTEHVEEAIKNKIKNGKC